MQLVTLELSDLALRAHSGLFTSDELGLGRDPEPLEQVVVYDKWSGDYFTGVISACEAEEGFELQIGLRLPEVMALSRVTGFPGPTTPVTTQPVADIAVALRDSLPSQ